MNVPALIGKVTLLLTAAIALAWLLRRQPASHRAAAWQAALSASLLLPFLSILLPSWRVSLPVMPDSQLLTISVFGRSTAASGSARIGMVVTFVWVLGFVFAAARIAIGNWMIWRAVKAGTVLRADGVEIPVIESVRIHTPLLWGVTKSLILVPAGWDMRSAGERALILAHEAAHARRRDTFFQLVARVASAIYWFHPLVWIAAARLRRESEMACDDAVLESGAVASSYAGLLLGTAESFRLSPAMAPVTLAMARPSQVQARIRSVLDSRVERGALGRRGAALAMVLLLAVVLPVAAMQNGDDDDRVYKLGEGIVAPRPIDKREPAYTQEARDARIEGSVLLAIEIDKEGKVRRAEVVRGLDAGLDQNALDTIRTWLFEPARKAGKPVIVSARVEINFRLQ